MIANVVARGFRPLIALAMILTSLIAIETPRVAAAPSGAGTTVGGVISADTTWPASGSPFLVNSSVQIPADVTLTIAPGVVVEATGLAAGDPMFLIHGALSAQGEPGNRIVLDGGGNAQFFSDESAPTTAVTDISFAEIVDGESLWGWSWMTTYNIRDSVVEDIERESRLRLPSSDSHFERNVFRRAAGFTLETDYADVIFRDNRFESRSSSAPNYWLRGSGWFQNVEPIIENNSFVSSGVGIEMDAPTSNGDRMSAEGNFWGTTDPAQIATRIVDYNDLLSRGEVEFVPFLMSDPLPGVVGFDNHTQLVYEHEQPYSIPVSRSGGAPQESTVYYTVTTTGAALPALFGTLEWASGDDDTKFVEVPLSAVGGAGTTFTISLNDFGGAFPGDIRTTAVSILKSGAISGSVVDSADGEPIADATLTLTPEGGASSPIALETDGSYNTGAIADGIYSVAASAPGTTRSNPPP